MYSKRDAYQAVFRQVNERINELNEASAEAVGVDPQFVCECPDLSCAAPVSVPLGTYQRVRTAPAWFIVVPGHVDHELENIVEEHDDYVIVAVPGHLLPRAPTATRI